MSDEGWIYVLTNPAMPGLVKIGMTRDTPRARARDLSRVTGVPVPFAVACCARVADPAAAERRFHRSLSGRRVSSRREFFRASPREAARAMRAAAGMRPSWSAPLPAVAALAAACAALLSAGGAR